MNATTEPPTALDCDGYRKLLAAVERDEKDAPNFHDYRAKLLWIISRANHYAEKTGLSPESILDAWEERRNYWYMNFYQEGQQPEIKGDTVKVFETVAELEESIDARGFRCPSCEGVSKSPYTCDTGIIAHGKPCDWKVYGLFGHLGKGVFVFVKEKLTGENLFMPVAWESATTKGDAPA